jgi:hypothetical protein
VLAPDHDGEPDSWAFIEPSSDASTNVGRILDASAADA